MANYKIWLTVKDRYGNTKEIDGGNINVGLDELTQDEINNLEEALPLEEYLKIKDIDKELKHYATDEELLTTVQTNESIRYSDFEIKD